MQTRAMKARGTAARVGVLTLAARSLVHDPLTMTVHLFPATIRHQR